jgi:probable addiction module antidote protein
MTSLSKPKVSPESSPEELANYINFAMKSSDLVEIRQAIGYATRMHNMSDLAKLAGIERTSIYRAFGGSQSPSFLTVIRTLGAMGLQLKVTPSRGQRAQLALVKKSKLNSTL